MRPVTQRCHADPYCQDDQSQEEEEPRGRVEAEPTTYHHHIGAALPFSKGKTEKAEFLQACTSNQQKTAM